MVFAKQLKENVQKLMREHHYKPWDIARMTLSDIRRMFGTVTMPTRKVKK